VYRVNQPRRRRAIPAKVFVGNLSFKTTQQELTDWLSVAGQIVDVYLPTDRNTGRPRGFAFVEFASDGEAEEAIRQFDSKELGGRALRIHPAEDRPTRAPRTFRPSTPDFDDGGGGGGFGGRGPAKAKGSRRGLRARKRSL
jgi:RNA recognition motif-containing protein